MKKNVGRIMALAVSAAVFASSVRVVYAAGGEQVGPPKAEENLKIKDEKNQEIEPEPATASESVPETEAVKDDQGSEIAQVVLPTSAIDIFDFILDPQELIKATNAAAYGGKVFEDGATLFFERSDGKAEEDYTSDSDGIIITNRDDKPVEVEINANVSVAMAESLFMTEDREFTNDTRASLYLALTDGEKVVPITLEEGASIQTVVPAAVADVGEDANEDDTDESDAGTEDTESGEEGQYSFWLTGAANKNGNWSSLKDMEIEVTVTWKVVPTQEEESPEEEAGENLNEGEKATSSDAAPVGGEKATPSDATASEVEKETDEMPSKATGSEIEKDKEDETPPKATGNEVERIIKETQPVKPAAKHTEKGKETASKAVAENEEEK